MSGSFLCSSSCVKNIGKDCTATVYTFELPFNAVPDKDSIRLGDSITFSINAPTTFVDINSGHEIDYSGSGNLGGTIGFIKYDSTTKKWKPSANQFKYTLKKGVWETPMDTLMFRAYHCSEAGHRYVFELTIAPETVGLYGVVFGNSGNTFRGSDPCVKAGFTVNLQESSHNRYLDGDYNEITPGGDFYFHVSP